MIRDIATVMRGTLIAQAIGFAALPVLSRVFPPDAFGHYQLFISLLTLLLVFPTLRYEVALLRAEDGDEFRALVQVCLVLSIAISLLAGVILTVMSHAGWPRQISDLPFPTWMLLIGMTFGGVAQFVTIIATREKSFAAIANSKIVQSLAYVVIGIGLGTLTRSRSGLVLADLAGRIVLVGCLVLWASRAFRNNHQLASRAQMLAVARRYREYPYISAPGTVINVLGGIISPIMIYASFSPAASGQYSLVDRSIGLPLSLVVTSVAQVFTAQFSAELRRDVHNAAAHFWRVVGFMALLALIPLVAVMSAGPWLFGWIFGVQWRLAGHISQLMAPAYASILLSGPTNMVLTVMGYQKMQTAWEIARLTLVVGLWSVVPRFHIPLEIAIAGYSAVLVLCNLGFVALAYAALRRSIRLQTQPLRSDPQ